MFKRIIIGMMALSFIVIFTAEAANARASRYVRSVDHEHDCTSGEKCYGADTVTDKLYGAEIIALNGDGSCDGFLATDGNCYRPTCEITGTLVCLTPVEEECGVFPDEPFKLTQDTYQSTEDFVGGAETINITNLTVAEGTAECLARELGEYFDYWPDAIVALSFYTGNFPNIGDPAPTTYELIEVCPSYDPLSREYNCELWYDSAPLELPVPQTDVRPHLPCCGEPTTLTVDVIGGGTVTSVDGNINCDNEGGENCIGTYGTESPFDTCPEVTLKASTAPIYNEWNGWSVECDDGTDACIVSCPDLAGDCVVTPNADVTANYGIADGYIRVVVDKGIVDGAYVWIKEPQKALFTYPEPQAVNCTGECYIDVSQLTFKKDANAIVLKRAGGEFVTWIGLEPVCDEGDNNSLTTCAIPTVLPLVVQEVIAQWAQE